MLEHLAAQSVLNWTNDVLYVGREGGPEQRIASNLQIPFVGIRVGGLRSLGAATQARNLSHMMRASRFAAQAIAKFRPNVVLATGGYVSAPVLWAAWRKKIPIIIELPDLEPGWAIQATWRLSKQVAVSFDDVLKFFPRGRATVTGYPVRPAFYQATRQAGRAHFQFDTQMPVVTVFGGSQGAHALNESVRTNLRTLLAVTQIIHISGAKDRADLEDARAQLEPELARSYRVFEYLNEDMPLALAAADVIVARAGAATLGEFPAVGVPSILVPGLFAHGHQEKNAAFLAERGAALSLSESQLSRDLIPTLTQLLHDQARLAAMTAAVKRLARPDAAKNIAALLQGV